MKHELLTVKIELENVRMWLSRYGRIGGKGDGIGLHADIGCLTAPLNLTTEYSKFSENFPHEKMRRGNYSYSAIR